MANLKVIIPAIIIVALIASVAIFVFNPSQPSTSPLPGQSEPTSPSGPTSPSEQTSPSSPTAPSTGGTTLPGATTPVIIQQVAEGVTTGTLEVLITDAPPPRDPPERPSPPENKTTRGGPPQERTMVELDLTITELILHYQGNISANAPHNQWKFNASLPRTFNLLALTNQSLLLGAVDVPTGNITMIVFQVSKAVAKFEDGSTAELTVVANGKFMIPIRFEVLSTGTTSLTIDIQPESLKITPSDILRPIVKTRVEHRP